MDLGKSAVIIPSSQYKNTIGKKIFPDWGDLKKYLKVF